MKIFKVMKLLNLNILCVKTCSSTLFSRQFVEKTKKHYFDEVLKSEKVSSIINTFALVNRFS